MNAFDIQTMIKVALVDDHQLMIDGIRLLLKDYADIDITVTAGNGKEFIETLKSQEVDIVILDIQMPEMDGVETIKVLKKEFPDVSTIVLSVLGEIKLVREMLKYGAMGYVLKNTSGNELKRAIDTVHNGDYYFTPAIQGKLIGLPQPKREKKEKKNYTREGHHAALTKREKEILKLIAEEYTGPEISAHLHISLNTVETHRRNLVQKIGAKSSIGLVRYAIKHGLVDL